LVCWVKKFILKISILYPYGDIAEPKVGANLMKLAYNEEKIIK